MASSVSFLQGNIPVAALTLAVKLRHQRFCVWEGMRRLLEQCPCSLMYARTSLILSSGYWTTAPIPSGMIVNVFLQKGHLFLWIHMETNTPFSFSRCLFLHPCP